MLPFRWRHLPPCEASAFRMSFLIFWKCGRFQGCFVQGMGLGDLLQGSGSKKMKHNAHTHTHTHTHIFISITHIVFKMKDLFPHGVCHTMFRMRNNYFYNENTFFGFKTKDSLPTRCQPIYYLLYVLGSTNSNLPTGLPLNKLMEHVVG